MKTIFGAVVALLTAILFVFTYLLGLAHGVKLDKLVSTPTTRPRVPYTPGPNEHVARGTNG
jgi:hypothetical protein